MSLALRVLNQTEYDRRKAQFLLCKNQMKTTEQKCYNLTVKLSYTQGVIIPCMCVRVSVVSVLSSDAEWQNILFYNCCYHYAAFTNISKEVKRTEILSYRRHGVRDEEVEEITPN
jgi:hypothetical protein